MLCALAHTLSVEYTFIYLTIYLFILSITSRHRRQSCSFSSSLSVSVLGYSDCCIGCVLLNHGAFLCL